jgi:hypothetical protein
MTRPTRYRLGLIPALALGGITLVAAIAFGGFAWLLRSRGSVFNSGDPIGYYVYLRSLTHDGDIDFTNDYAFFQPSDEIPGPNLGRIDSITGLPDNNYTIGLPLLVAPAYAVGTLLLAHSYPASRAGERFPLFLDQLIFSFGGLLVAAAGIWLSFRFVCQYYPERDSLLATVVFWLCSPLLYYTAREPFQSHSASVFAVSLFLYVWSVPSLRRRLRWALMGVSAALVLMARQQDGVVFLLPLGTAVLQDGWRKSSQKAMAALPFLGAGFATLFALQMLVWHALRGSFLTYSYRGFDFAYLTSPRVVEVLLSSNHGLISWHPMIAVCLLGLVLMSMREQPVLGWLSLACFAAELYVIASWWCWWMGYSFGHRGFLSLTPLFILGLAAVLSRLTRPWPRRIFVAAAACLFLWNVVLMFAYLSEMIPYQGEFSWLQLLASLPQLPIRILAKARSV